MGERPTGGAEYPVPGFYRRIGAFIETDDRWWTIRTEADLEPVAAEVITAARPGVLPELRSQLAAAADS